MRLPRNVKMLRGPVDAAAVAGTVFLLWIATFLHSSLVAPPGVRMKLPDAEGWWGEVLPDLSLAVDPAGRLLFENQVLAEEDLERRLRERLVAQPGAGATLLLMADRTVASGTLSRLANRARQAGVTEIILATSPRPEPASGGASKAGDAPEKRP